MYPLCVQVHTQTGEYHSLELVGRCGSPIRISPAEFDCVGCVPSSISGATSLIRGVHFGRSSHTITSQSITSGSHSTLVVQPEEYEQPLARQELNSLWQQVEQTKALVMSRLPVVVEEKGEPHSTAELTRAQVSLIHSCAKLTNALNVVHTEHVREMEVLLRLLSRVERCEHSLFTRKQEGARSGAGSQSTNEFKAISVKRDTILNTLEHTLDWFQTRRACVLASIHTEHTLSLDGEERVASADVSQGKKCIEGVGDSSTMAFRLCRLYLSSSRIRLSGDPANLVGDPRENRKQLVRLLAQIVSVENSLDMSSLKYRWTRVRDTVFEVANTTQRPSSLQMGVISASSDTKLSQMDLLGLEAENQQSQRHENTEVTGKDFEHFSFALRSYDYSIEWVREQKSKGFTYHHLIEPKMALGDLLPTISVPVSSFVGTSVTVSKPHGAKVCDSGGSIAALIPPPSWRKFTDPSSWNHIVPKEEHESTDLSNVENDAVPITNPAEQSESAHLDQVSLDFGLVSVHERGEFDTT
jgi:hypothetical protein